MKLDILRIEWWNEISFHKSTFKLKANYLAKVRLKVSVMRGALTNEFIYSRDAKYKSCVYAATESINVMKTFWKYLFCFKE